MERQLPAGNDLTDYFDLLAGTSTGGIVTLGLGVGRSAQDMLDLYLNRGGEIFPPSRFVKLRLILGGFRRPVFDRDRLDRILEQELGDAGFWEVNTRMCVPAVEGNYGEVYIYRTPHHPDYRQDWRRSVVEVARATSAAPVYLEAVEQSGYALVDGGLFANDPIMVALVDALACFDVPRDRIKILSLGCLKDAWNLHNLQSLGKGWLAWTLRAYEVTGSLQSQNAQGQAGLLAGPENILRIDAPQPTRRISLDDWVRARTELPGIADLLLKEYLDQANQMFFERKVEAYTPVYTPEHSPG